MLSAARADWIAPGVCCAAGRPEQLRQVLRPPRPAGEGAAIARADRIGHGAGQAVRAVAARAAERRGLTIGRRVIEDSRPTCPVLVDGVRVGMLRATRAGTDAGGGWVWTAAVPWMPLASWRLLREARAAVARAWSPP